LSDPIMRRVIRTIGPCTLEPQLRRSPYEALVRAVVYQQLHGRAAAAILGRFIALFGGKAFPRPRAVLAMSTRKMRGAGLSRAKAVHAHGERWRPHRTTAAWYLWRVADRAKRVAVAKR